MVKKKEEKKLLQKNSLTKYLGHFDSGMTIGFYSHALFFGKKRLECAQKKVLNMGWEKWLE